MTDHSTARSRLPNSRTVLLTLVIIASVIAALTIRLSGGLTTHHTAAPATAPVTTPVTTTQPQLSAAQLASWNAQVATPEGRTAIVDGFRKVFGDQAQIGFGDPPVGAMTTGVQQATFHDMQAGISGNHFWFILTDYEVRQGFGWGLKASCFAALSLAGALICGSVITAIEGYSYGSANNHGVWGAVYWAPPHISAGRW